MRLIERHETFEKWHVGQMHWHARRVNVEMDCYRIADRFIMDNADFRLLFGRAGLSAFSLTGNDEVRIAVEVWLEEHLREPVQLAFADRDKQTEGVMLLERVPG